MNSSRSKIAEIFLCIYLAYFCMFLFLIQHPNFHNISVDINYTNISDYITIEEECGGLPPSEQHFHNYSEKHEEICIVCNILNAGFNDNPNVQSIDIHDFKSFILHTHNIQFHNSIICCLPFLRAPPLS